MKIVHFSDWHGQQMRLPSADLYVCTGDMYADYVQGTEPRAQVAEAAQRAGWFRTVAASPDAPIVCVRGNHDIAPLAPLFVGCNLVHEFVDNEQVTLAGLRVTGHRGIPSVPLSRGGWSDELSRADLMDRVRAMPAADLVLTHYAPQGILDSNFGLGGMVNVLWHKLDGHGLHCFGHIHECGGLVERIDELTFSNAACTFNVVTI